MTPAAFRRRILIEAGPNRVIAQLEDDWHRMSVVVHHEGGVARRIEADMLRWPWTTCRGAIAQLQTTFTGVALADFARHAGKSQNCTHLHDLAVWAANHAGATATVTYDVTVADPVDGTNEAKIVRDGQTVMAWILARAELLAPVEIAGQTLYTLNDWIAGLDHAQQEAARILRWAAILGFGRAMDIPEGTPGTVFGGGRCFTFQPAVAAVARRRPDAERDFSRSGAVPLADRADAFARD